MGEIDFTIVTVTYNAAATLGRTLESVEAQTFRRFEHLVIDGGSGDGTVGMAEAYRRRNADIGVTVVSERDRGLYDAMNKGIARARGTFVCFLNAGDRLHDRRTLERIAPLATDECGVIYGETDIVDEAGRFLRHRRLRAPGRLTWRSFMRGMVVCHQSFYARRELAPPYDLSYRFSADFDWCVRVMKAAESRGLALANARRVLTDYLAEGMTTRNHGASLRERFRIMARHYGWLAAVGMHAWFAVRAAVKR